MNFNVIVLYVLLFFPKENSFNQILENLQLNLLSNISNHLFTDCLIFVWKLDQKRTFSLMKAMSASAFQFCSTTEVSFFPSGHSSILRFCLRPSYVVLEELNRDELASVLSVPRGLSQVTWLFFTPISEHLQKVTLNLNHLLLWIPSDFFAKDSIIVMESFRVAPKLPIRLRPYAIWSQKQGLVIKDYSSDGTDLEGIVLKAAIFESEPLNYLKILGPNDVVMDGYFARVGEVLEETLNFSMKMAVWDYTTNKTIFHALHALANEEIDIIPSALEMTSSRVEIISFTAPIEFTTMDIIIREPETQESSWWNYVSPLSWEMWLCTFFLYFLVWNFLYFADKENGLSWSECGLYSLGIMFCQQGHPHPPCAFQARLVLLSGLLFGIVLYASYSAVFISFLTIIKEDMPFSTLREMLTKKSYLLGVYKDSFLHDDFKNAQDGLMSEIYTTLMPINNFPLTAEEALQRICKEKYAHIDYHTMLMVNSATCTLVSLKEYYTKSTSAMGLPHYSPYRKLFNKLIIQMSNFGLLKNLKKYPTKVDKEHEDFDVVTLSDIKFPLSFILFGLIFSIIVFIIEWIQYNYFKNKNSSKMNFKLKSYQK